VGEVPRLLLGAFTDTWASVLFLTSYGLGKFDLVMEKLDVNPKGIRAEYQHLLVQEYKDEYGRVHPSEVIESWVEAGFEVRVVREGIWGGGGGSNRGLLHGVRPALTDFKSAVARPWLRVFGTFRRRHGPVLGDLKWWRRIGGGSRGRRHEGVD